MRYFRNTELAKLYDISEKTVRNWIKQSKDGKLDFDIYTDEKGKSYIAETTKNSLLIKDQIEENKKYRNSKTHKVVKPTQKFYEIYTWPQIYDIISHLEKFNEFPFYYSHCGDGWKVFAQYYERLYNEQVPNSQTFSRIFFSMFSPAAICQPGVDKFSILELGGRTGLTTVEFARKLKEQGCLKQYINIDVSSGLLHLNEKLYKKVLGENSKIFQYQRDIINDQLADITLLSSNSGQSTNLVMLLGGIYHNFNSPQTLLRKIRNSICPRDYFFLSTKLDSEAARRYFDFNPSFNGQLLPQKQKFLVDVLNIEPSFYDVEQYYDEQERQRKIQVRLKFDVTVKFKLQTGTKSIDFKKGETIMLWRFWHQTMEEMVQEFTDCGFNVVQAIKSPDEQYAMIIAKVRADKNKHC